MNKVTADGCYRKQNNGTVFAPAHAGANLLWSLTATECGAVSFCEDKAGDNRNARWRYE